MSNLSTLWNDSWLIGWLALVLAWLIAVALRLWFSFRSRQVAFDLFRTYAAQGKEPPQELLLLAQQRLLPSVWNKYQPWPGGEYQIRFAIID